MNLLQLLNNTEVEVEKEPMSNEEPSCILRGEFYQGGLICVKVKLNGVEVRAMIDTGATTNLIEVNLVPRLRLQVAKANLVVGFTSHHQVVPNGIAMANLSVGTWAQDTSFVVMAMSRYNVILGMEFLYNAKVHVHPHLSCIWIGGLEEPCMVEYEYLNANRPETSLQTTNGGLVEGNSAMMLLVEERVQVVEGLDEYTTMSRGFVAGESLGPQLNKLPDKDMDQGEGELEAKSLGEDSDYWKTHHNENVGDILSGTSNNEYLLNKGDYGCFKEEAWGFRHFKLASGVPVITSLWAIRFMMLLFGTTSLFSIFWMRMWES